MGREHLAEAFAAWSSARGLVTRDIDRKRVLRDLLELAGSAPIEEAHIERLSKTYRQGLMGARAVLAARQVGFEILEWQVEVGPFETESAQPPSPPPSTNVSVPPPAPRAPLSDHPAPFEQPRTAETATQRSPSAAPPAVPTEDEWSEVAKSTPPPAFDPKFEVDRETKAKPTGYERRPSTRPPTTGLSIEESIQGISDERKKLRRLENLEGEIDGSSSSPSSMPPKPGASVRPEKRSPSVRPPSVRPGSAPPSSKAPPSIRPPASASFQSPAYVPPPEPPPRISRRMLMGGGVALALPIISFALKWPRSLYADEARAVTGRFDSKHLGIGWSFGGSWKHAEQLDDGSTVPKGKRRVSVFYQGTSHDVFTSQLTVVVFAGGAALNADDARQLGANETMGTMQGRQCDTFSLPSMEGMRCSATGSFVGVSVAVLEYYFAIAGKAVFFRLMVPLGAPVAEGDQEATERARDERERRMRELTESAEGILKTMHALP